MSISCADLKGLRHFRQIRLVAGEKGLYRQISWPFICTTSTISQWLHGGELIFISGAGLDCGEESLLSLMRESVSKGLAGMVMLTGERYIPEIPPSLVEPADASCFPLFEMPWDVKLIDVTQEISENIMYRKEQAKKGQRFLEQLLFSADDSRTFEELSGLFGIPQRAFRFIAVAEIQAGDPAAAALDTIKSDLSHTLKSCGEGEGRSVLAMGYLNTVVCLALGKTERDADALDKCLTETFGVLSKRYPHAPLRLGFGRVCQKGCPIRTSYSEAKKALATMAKGISREQVLHYSELGIFRLFFEIENPEEIRKYSRENLGPLLEADQKNGSDLVGTLRSYLYNNCNLLRTSQALYIHRNTLIYRLNTIKGLLAKDLDDAFVRHELFNSILAAEFIEK